MYERHWNLSTKPFQNDFDRRMFFPSATHEEAMTRLLYAFSEEKSVMLLTGLSGVGKSYVAHLFVSECKKRGIPAVYIGIPDSDPLELIVQIASAFGLQRESRDKYRLIEAIQAHIRSNEVGRGLLVLDEVQNLREAKCLEEVRLLTSLTSGHRRMFTIVLAGGPALARLISEDEALATRIELSCQIRRLSVEETVRYVTHRLEAAGRRETVFSPEAMEAIHVMTEGVPRLINTLCDICMFASAGRKLDWVGLEILEEARSDLKDLIVTRTPEAML